MLEESGLSFAFGDSTVQLSFNCTVVGSGALCNGLYQLCLVSNHVQESFSVESSVPKRSLSNEMPSLYNP